MTRASNVFPLWPCSDATMAAKLKFGIGVANPLSNRSDRHRRPPPPRTVRPVAKGAPQAKPPNRNESPSKRKMLVDGRKRRPPRDPCPRASAPGAGNGPGPRGRDMPSKTDRFDGGVHHHTDPEFPLNRSTR